MTQNNSYEQQSERKAKKKRFKKSNLKYRCEACQAPYNVSTAMNEQKFCSLRCEGTVR